MRKPRSRNYKAREGYAQLRQPYAEFLLGDIDRGPMHTSVAMTPVDSPCGAAAFSALGDGASIATLDLRMDYLRPAVAGKDLIADARVDRITKHVVFISTTVWQDSPDEPTAAARVAFMRSANSKPAIVLEK